MCVSGINFLETNFQINPQTVYNKDLSNIVVGDNNIIFGNFNNCILYGADLSREIESLVFDGAYIDESTKLPKHNNLDGVRIRT